MKFSEYYIWKGICLEVQLKRKLNRFYFYHCRLTEIIPAKRLRWRFEIDGITKMILMFFDLQIPRFEGERIEKYNFYSGQSRVLLIHHSLYVLKIFFFRQMLKYNAKNIHNFLNTQEINWSAFLPSDIDN